MALSLFLSHHWVFLLIFRLFKYTIFLWVIKLNLIIQFQFYLQFTFYITFSVIYWAKSSNVSNNIMILISLCTYTTLYYTFSHHFECALLPLKESKISKGNIKQFNRPTESDAILIRANHFTSTILMFVQPFSPNWQGLIHYRNLFGRRWH